jgi:hypothetical protein
MHLFLILKGLKSKRWFAALIFLPFLGKTQSDSLPYRSFSENVVFFGDLGYASAPFSVFNDFPGDLERIKYRNNFRPIIGVGIAYKWFSLRVSSSLPVEMRSEQLYGKTKQMNLGVDFTIKKTFIDLDLRNYQGYAIENAYVWNDSLDENNPNDIQNRMNAASFSANVWYFNNEHFKMQAIRGRTGYYTKPTHTWYLKNTLNFFGVGNNESPIIPIELSNLNNTKTLAKIYSAIDIGTIPGYAYVNRIKNWQFSGSFGFGPVIQAKFYSANGNTRGFLGLAPRYDLRLIGGYNTDKYFVMLITDFDNKSIRFNELKYRQSFYYIRFAAGYRFLEKKSAKRVKQ